MEIRLSIKSWTNALIVIAQTPKGFNMKKIILILFIASICIVSCSAASIKTGDEKPNIIIIFTDDHGYSDLSCQGVYDDVKTPNIDKLAESGVRMTSGYVTSPQCVPSRGGLISGQYQNRFGLESNGKNAQAPGAMEKFDRLETIPERLQKAGYATGMAGKWHLGPSKEIASHGFDMVFFKNSNRAGMTNFNFEGEIIPWGEEETGMYHLDACSEAACTFIKKNKEKPFFFYLAYRAPHVPLDATKKYLDRFPGEMPERRRQALAMLSAVDDGVGKIVKTLKENGLRENTIIFVMGDNGAPLKIHKLDAPGGGPGWDGSLNDPMNGEKGMLTEGGIRIPFVVNWKGKIPGGQVYSQPVISLDAGATALAIAGLPHDPELDGVNLVPYLRGEKVGAPHEALYWRWIAQSAIRKDNWKYVRCNDREYLFDIEKDKEEKNDLLDRHPEIAEELLEDLNSWCTTLDPPGIGSVKNDNMSRKAEEYFDYYIEGIKNTGE
jgi:uncharacterized sulfatase